MKTLQEIQEENRKFIIMANNPTAKTYDEALEMELGIGCIIFDILDAISNRQAECNYHKIICSGEIIFTVKSLDGYNSFNDICLENLLCKDVFKIIGKPLTLSRVLISINTHFEFFKNYNKLLNNNHILEFENPDNNISEILLSWDLTKETLEEQSEETQREINKLFIKSL